MVTAQSQTGTMLTLSLKHQRLVGKSFLKAWESRKKCHLSDFTKVFKLNPAVIFIVITYLLTVKYHTSGSEVTSAL